MKVYTEYQVNELLKKQRILCAGVVESYSRENGHSNHKLAEKVLQKKVTRAFPTMEAYFAQDMKRCFLAGFGAGFDACTIHWNESTADDKLEAFNYHQEFGKWLLHYKNIRDRARYDLRKGKASQNDSDEVASV